MSGWLEVELHNAYGILSESTKKQS